MLKIQWQLGVFEEPQLARSVPVVRQKPLARGDCPVDGPPSPPVEFVLHSTGRAGPDQPAVFCRPATTRKGPVVPFLSKSSILY